MMMKGDWGKLCEFCTNITNVACAAQKGRKKIVQRVQGDSITCTISGEDCSLLALTPILQNIN